MSGCANCVRMSNAKTPPTRKKASENMPRFRPIRLWSVLVRAPSHPLARRGIVLVAVPALMPPPARRRWPRPESGRGRRL